MPDTIEDAFAKLDLHLLPHNKTDFKTTCSCPDWGDPCKHIAGVYYLLAAQLDQDPFLLFELKGLSRQALQTELMKSPLGQALSAELATTASAPTPVTSYYTVPTLQSAATLADLKDYWQPHKPLPPSPEPTRIGTVPAILVKKQGDFPAFWPKSSSFIAAMETIYTRVRTKNSHLL